MEKKRKLNKKRVFFAVLFVVIVIESIVLIVKNTHKTVETASEEVNEDIQIEELSEKDTKGKRRNTN